MNLASRLKNKFINWFDKVHLRVTSQRDSSYLADGVPLSQKVSHRNLEAYLAEVGNKPGMRILEVGSREVTGPSRARKFLDQANYVGFDYYAGPNVDVVGDAHKLSSYFDGQDCFDIVFSTACFEHFAMPWLVAAEIAKVLKVGGLVVVETHFAFSAHERPWHFFHYTDMAMRVLFCPAMGFECIEAGMSNPLVARFSSLAEGYLATAPLRGLYCHVEYLGKKVRDVPDFDWRTADIDQVVGTTKYPPPKAGS